MVENREKSDSMRTGQMARKIQQGAKNVCTVPIYVQNHREPITYIYIQCMEKMYGLQVYGCDQQFVAIADAIPNKVATSRFKLSELCESV